MLGESIDSMSVNVSSSNTGASLGGAAVNALLDKLKQEIAESGSTGA